MKTSLVCFLCIFVSFFIFNTAVASDPFPKKIPFTIMNHTGEKLKFTYDGSHALYVPVTNLQFELGPTEIRKFEGKMDNRRGNTNWYRFKVTRSDGKGGVLGIAEIVVYNTYEKINNCWSVRLHSGRSTVKDVDVVHDEYICQHKL